MRRHTRIVAAVAAAATAAATATAATLAVTATGAAAGAGGAGHPAGGRLAATALPRHVFAPYYEAYNTSAGGPAAQSQASGAKFLSLAFLQTDQPGSCTAYWNGDTSQPISQATFGSDISAIQAAGGNVIPSFGGYSADTTGTDIADSCSSVAAIAGVYENVIRTYKVPRIDLDVEANSLTNTAGIDRRNQAIAMVEAWAAASHRKVQFSYTVPSTTTGLTSSEVSLLQSAIANGATVSVVNIMTFDYYIGTKQHMAADTKRAAAGLHGQLRALYPASSSARLWHMIGVTEMPGIDDFGPDETFFKYSAALVLDWAEQKGIGTLSFWALQRDNGGCPGTKGAGTCSGLKQPAWYFSHVFEPFTR